MRFKQVSAGSAVHFEPEYRHIQTVGLSLSLFYLPGQVRQKIEKMGAIFDFSAVPTIALIAPMRSLDSQEAVC